MIRKPIANYTAEEALFRDLVESDTESNILIFQGQSGSGKSHLIEYCLSTVPDNMPSTSLKLQGGRDEIPGLFTTMGRRVGWDALPQFIDTVARLLEQPGKEKDPLWQIGMRRHLADVGKNRDLESHLDRFQQLTEAWFYDLKQLNKPFLLAIDGYEQGSTQFKDWFGQDFLDGVANFGEMRVLVGGQEVPTKDDRWGFRAKLRELEGVSEVEAWLDWAAEAGFQVHSPDILTGVVIGSKGQPSEIVKFIEAQSPRSEPLVGLGRSEVSQLKQLRETIIRVFGLEELKTISFDAGIDYENIRGHRDQKSIFARELLAYARRIGLFTKLIEAFRAEWPPNVHWVY